MYDITQHKTFVNLLTWLSELREHTGSDLVTVLVGNKSDLRHLRTVMKEEVATFAGKHLLTHIVLASTVHVLQLLFKLYFAVVRIGG